MFFARVCFLNVFVLSVFIFDQSLYVYTDAICVKFCVKPPVSHHCISRPGQAMSYKPFLCSLEPHCLCLCGVAPEPAAAARQPGCHVSLSVFAHWPIRSAPPINTSLCPCTYPLRAVQRYMTQDSPVCLFTTFH